MYDPIIVENDDCSLSLSIIIWYFITQTCQKTFAVSSLDSSWTPSLWRLLGITYHLRIFTEPIQQGHYSSDNKALFYILSEGPSVASKHQLTAFSHRLFRIACEMKVKDTLGLATQPQSNMTKPWWLECWLIHIQMFKINILNSMTFKSRILSKNKCFKYHDGIILGRLLL